MNVAESYRSCLHLDFFLKLIYSPLKSPEKFKFKNLQCFEKIISLKEQFNLNEITNTNESTK